MKNNWWKERVFYQIYPRSFQDSNGDGIGDIPGLISRLDYLQWLGIGAVWLCPVYDSPNDDMGYDIRDYRKIMSEFGTMEDFDRLLKEMHRRDIKLVMDLVVNHSSDENAWFVESRKSKDNPYRDYYIWRDGRGRGEPNNWSSFFTPSAWSYDAATDQWYLHLFGEKQPDLNWENPKLREEVYSMINWWFDKGVDGFRMDVISLIAKAPGLPNARGDGYVFPGEYTAFQPELHTYLREMRARCFAGRNCMCVGETTCVTLENANSVVGDGNELDLLFQFDIMDIDGENGKWNVIPFSLKKFKALTAAWQKTLDWNTLFWGNHDQPRIVSRWGCTASEPLRQRSAKMLAAAMYLQRGTPFIYQGEEIGMTNYPFADASQLRDIESLNLLKEAKTDEQAAWAWNGIRNPLDRCKPQRRRDQCAERAGGREFHSAFLPPSHRPARGERCAQMGRLPDACPGRSAAFCLPPEPCGGIDRRVVQFQRCTLPTLLPPGRRDPARRRLDRYRICALWLRGRFRRHTENE